MKYWDKKETVCELTVHDSPPQNDSTEHGMCTWVKQVRALLLASALLRYLWEEAMHHSIWLQNKRQFVLWMRRPLLRKDISKSLISLEYKNFDSYICVMIWLSSYPIDIFQLLIISERLPFGTIFGQPIFPYIPTHWYTIPLRTSHSPYQVIKRCSASIAS